ncbi:MAG TPA: dihydroorotate dehydrogenase electron transfer subunit [Candidatus Omnitrophota bacterium]|nr:dihydroorotate dehydrogenase electron transfer subunit [Candidatus Omnitrophota bacterium]
MAKKVFDEVVTILENRKVNVKYRKLVFRSGTLARGVRPGQFLHVRLNEGHDPFLRRPFSYYRTAKDRVEILYEVLGRGTAILAEKCKGDRLKVMGPLGNSFSTAIGKKKRVLVAGGIGVPPLVNLAEQFSSAYLLIGTKSRSEILPRSEIGKVKAKVLCSTEDGSVGTKGFVTTILETIIAKEGPGNLWIQTCGPKPMMKAVMAIAARYGIEGEASWDESMACGAGACLGCMVETRAGPKRACADGPVFSFRELAVA